MICLPSLNKDSAGRTSNGGRVTYLALVLIETA